MNRFRVYPYRWVVLGVYMFINFSMQLLWISYAPVTGPAAAYLEVGDLRIGLLSMVFMIAFIPFSIPSSWAIDTWGFRKSVGLGAAVMGVFGLMRGFAGDRYLPVLLCTIGIAAAQPLLLNSWTTLPSRWFPGNRRAGAVGLVTLANLAGTAAGMVLPPLLMESGLTIGNMQLLFGAAAAFSALLFLLLARDKPPTPPSEDAGAVRALVLEGLKKALASAPFRYTLAVAFVGLGIFNGVSTWVEGIIRPRGFDPSAAGTLGALMIAGGLLGAVILPALSDRSGKRQRFLYIALAGAIPGLVGITFARGAPLLFASAFVLGFFLVSALPVAMQYAAEVTAPVPEGTSNGLIQLFGQGAVVFVYIMAAMRGSGGAFTSSLILASALLGIGLFFVRGMKDVRKNPAD